MSEPNPASDHAAAREYAQIPASGAVLKGRALGIDIGGTGIKAAVVDVETGQLVSERIRQPTPQPPTPEAVLATVDAVVGQLTGSGLLTSEMPAGAGFPSAIRAGHALTAPHGEIAWVGQSIEQLLGDRLSRTVTVLNDSDAAGVAEMAYGAGRGHPGVVLLLDLGTGIGTTLFTKGELVPNVQLGHVEFHGHDAETRVSPVARKRRNLDWKAWGREFNELLAIYEAYLWPDLIILGGGLAKDFSKCSGFLETKSALVPAALENLAGIVGAARVAASAGTHLDQDGLTVEAS